MESMVAAQFSEFLDQSLGGLTRLAMVLTLDRSDADDLVQQSVLRIQEKWHLVGRADDPASYARRLLVNEFRSNQRRRKREGLWRFRWETSVATVDDIAGQVERRQLVVQLLGKLPVRQRIAIALRYLEDRPDHEIASILQCSTGTVRSLVKRGLDGLRLDLGADQTSRKEAHQ